MSYSNRPQQYSPKGNGNGNSNGNGNGYNRAPSIQSHHSSQQQHRDDEYNRLLKNYKLAHERIELQRVQLVSQENQNAALREHVALLENGGEGSSGGGVIGYTSGGGGTTIDDFTIRNHSSNLASRIHNWSGDSISNYLRTHDTGPPTVLQERYPHLIPSDLLLVPLLKALLQDLGQDQVSSSPLLFALDKDGYDSIAALGIIVQSLLRHVMSEILAEAIINRLLITDSEQTNLELTKIHTILFDREPLIAALWRRHTFSAAVPTLHPSLAITLFTTYIPTTFSQTESDPTNLSPSLNAVLESAFKFSRILHAGNNSSSTGSGLVGGANGGSGFHRAFVPAIGSILDPTKIELIKKCYRTERGEEERVGACLFPGLAKISPVTLSPDNLSAESSQPGEREIRIVIVRRAQVFCECALAGMR